MSIVLAGNWWLVTLRGLLSILFGVIVLAVPTTAITVLVLVFGVYALVNGALALLSAVRTGREPGRWTPGLWEGAISMLAGVFAIVSPGLTVLALVLLVAAWAVVTGAFGVFAAIRLRKTVRGEWLLALAAVASMVFGIALWWAPVFGAIVLVSWIGAYSIVLGALQLALAFRLRRWGQQVGALPEIKKAA
ncbi:MAG: HdeD family acid-resistance protein [Candidatus Korobacteraceae bacterium]